MTLHHHALIFDLDGTLIDSIPDVWRAVNRTMAAHDCNEVPFDAFEAMVGEGVRVMLEMAFRYGGREPDDDLISATLPEYLSFYMAHPVEHTLVYLGVREVLSAYHADGWALGVCTNKPAVMTDIVLRDLGLAPLFKGWTAGDNVPHRKPDGRHIEATLDAMGTTGMPAIMIGDSGTDLAAARDAGCPCILVSYGYNHGSSLIDDADAVVEDFYDVPAAVQRLLEAVQ